MPKAIAIINGGPPGPPGPPGDGEVLWSDIAADALASIAEAIAGTDDTRAITPLTLEAGLGGKSEVTSLGDDDYLPVITAGLANRKITKANLARGIYRNVVALSHAGAVEGETDCAGVVHDVRDFLASRGGGAILVDGKYHHTGITINAEGIHLVGIGMRSSELVGLNDEIGSANHIEFTAASFGSIRDLTVRAGTSNGAGAHGVVINNSVRMFMQNVIVQGVGGVGIVIGNESGQAHAARLSNVLVLLTGNTGMFLGDNAYDAQVENFWVGSAGQVTSGAPGIRVDTDWCRFANVHAWGCDGSGIDVRGHQSDFVNVLAEHNVGDGVDLFNAGRNTFSGLQVWANGGHGLQLNGTSDGNSIANAVARNNGGDGIEIAGGNRNRFVNVECVDDQDPKTQDVGFQIHSGVTDTMIVNLYSIASDHVTAGYQDAGTNTRLDANSIT